MLMPHRTAERASTAVKVTREPVSLEDPARHNEALTPDRLKATIPIAPTGITLLRLIR